MAKKDLDLLLNDFATGILREGLGSKEKITEARASINSTPHIYEINYEELVKEVTDQVAGLNAKKSATRITIDPYREKIIRDACKKYFNKVKVEMLKNRSGFKTTVLTNSGDYFSIRIEGNKNNSVFSTFIDKARYSALSELRSTLSTDLLLENDESVNTRIQGYMKNGQRIGGLLDIGHVEGYSIAEKRVQNLLEKLEAKVKTTSKRQTKTQSPLLRILAEVKTNPRVDKVKTISFKADVVVREQGVDSNRNIQSAKEFALINSIKKQIKALVDSEDWTNFSTSPSAIEITRQSILNVAKKSGGKVKVSQSNIKSSNYKTKKEIIETSTNTVEKDTGISLRGGKVARAPTQESSRQKNWSSFIPIINARLTDTVAKNMKSPRLNFRTGRFAQSAKVVNVEQTREGFPSFVFDYERDPYDVFDRTLGRRPWNTPQRDPRALVDISVREIVREMAIGRFFTRRA